MMLEREVAEGSPAQLITVLAGNPVSHIVDYRLPVALPVFVKIVLFYILGLILTIYMQILQPVIRADLPV
jgi:hypothetical protein